MSIDETDQILDRLELIEDRCELADDDERELVLASLRSDDEDVREAAKAAANAAIDDALCEALLDLLADGDADPEARSGAAIALGPSLELCDVDGFDDEDATPPISEEMFTRTRAALKAIYRDAKAPTIVRRRALEAAVRAPEEWQEGAVRGAWKSGDPEWRVTAIFSMGILGNFDETIIEAMDDADVDIACEAVYASMEASIESAVPKLIGFARNADADQSLRLAAIETLGGIGGDLGIAALEELSADDDDEIAAAADDALDMQAAITELVGVGLDDDDDYEFDDDDADDEDDDDDYEFEDDDADPEDDEEKEPPN